MEVPPDIEAKKQFQSSLLILLFIKTFDIRTDTKFLFFPTFGKPLALIFIIPVVIRMKVFPEKHLELSQTIALLIGFKGELLTGPPGVLPG
jgi:hypothetical protein